MKAVQWSGDVRKNASGTNQFFFRYRKDYDAYMQTLDEGPYIFLGLVKEKDTLHDQNKMKCYFSRLRWLAQQLAYTGNTSIDIDQTLMEQLGFFKREIDLRGVEKIKHWSHTILSDEQWLALINAQEQLALEQNLGSIPGKYEKQKMDEDMFRVSFDGTDVTAEVQRIP